MSADPGTAERTTRRFRPWRWLVGLAIAAVLIVAGAVGTLFYLSGTGHLSNDALRFANRLIARTANLDLEARRVLRTATGVRLEDVTLTIVEPGRRTRLLVAQRVDIVVSVWAMLRGREQTYVVHLTEPVITLTVDDQGRAILPEFRSTSESRQPPRDALRFVFERARLDVVDRRGRTRWLEQGSLGLRLDPDGRGYRVGLERGSGRVPPIGLVLRSVAGEARTGGPGFDLRRLHAITDAGELTASGSYADSTFRGELQATRWPWEFFGDLLEQPAISVPGYVDVHATFGGTTRRTEFAAELDGVWRSEPLAAQLDGRVSSDGVHFERANLRWRETTWDGSGSFARTGRWVFAGHVERLDLERLHALFPDLDLPPSGLSGNARIEGGSARLRVSAHDVSGWVRDLPLSDVTGSWELEGARQRGRGEGTIAGGRVRVEGTWTARALNLRGGGENLDIETLLAAAGYEADATGMVRRMTATLEGPIDRPHFDAEGVVEGAVISGVAVDSARAFGRGIVGREPNLEFGGEAFAVSGYGWIADTLEMAGALRGNDLRVPQVRAVHDDTVLTAALTGRRSGDRWDLEVWPAELRTDEWRFAATDPLLLTVGPDGATFERMNFAGDVGNFQLRGRYRTATDLDLYIAADSVDLAPIGRFAGRELEGQLAGTAHVEARGAQRHAILDLRAVDLISQGTRLDSAAVSLEASAAGPRLTLQSLRVAVPGGTVEGSGTLTLDEPSWPALPAAWPGKLENVRSWSGTLESRNFDLATVAALVPRARGLTGMATVRLDVGGTPNDPEAQFSGLVKDLAYGGFHFEEGEWRTRLENETLRIDNFELRQQGLSYRVSGTAPAPANLVQPGATDRTSAVPYDLRIEVPDGDLSLVPFLVPMVAAAEGRLHADVTVTGPRDALVVRGQAEVENARMRLSGREEIYEDIDLRLALRDSVILIEHGTARQGERGTITATGKLTLARGRIQAYDVDLHAERATAVASGEYVVEFDGDIAVGTGPYIGGVLPLPELSGTIRVREGVILYDFADPSNRVYYAGPERAPPWVYEVDVIAPGRVFWRSPSADIEVEAELTVEQALTYFSVLGTIDSRRGTYFFLGNQFRVDEGSLDFDSVEPMNPNIDATLVTEVAMARSNAGLTREEITITLQGRARQPEVTVASASRLPEREIFELLTYGRFGIDQPGISERDRSVILTATGTQYLMRQLASQFPDQAGLLRDLQVNTVVVGEGERAVVVPEFGIRRYLSSDLLVGYSQRVGGQPAGVDAPYRSIRAEYRINKIFYLTGEMIEHRLSSSSLPGSQRTDVEIGADVRARLEY